MSRREPPKPTVPSKRREAMGDFAFTTDLDALYKRGFPFLRVLSDEAIAPAKATREVVKCLNAIDPYLGMTVPREIARQYLRGYVHKNHDPSLPKKVAAADGGIDEKWLTEVLERKCSPTKSLDYGGETYDFRLAEVMFLFEAFLGTEVVASAIAEHLARARDNLKWWGTWIDHDHVEARRLATVLGWLRLRMPAARWKATVAPLVESNVAKLPQYCEALRVLANDGEPSDDLDFAMQRRAPKVLREHLDKWPFYWDNPHFFFVLGKEALLTVETARLPRLAKWQQLRIIDEFGTIRAPGTVRIMAGLLASRSAGEAAVTWLREHEDFVRNSLAVIDEASRNGVIAALNPNAKVVAPKIDKRAMEKEVRAIFARIEKLLAAQKANLEKERAVMVAAFNRYCETRAALGEVIPEAYFTHQFADVTPKWRVDEATSHRWIDLAVDVAGG